MSCETCHGSLVSLLYYRHWAETQKLAAQPDTAAPTAGPVATSDSPTALVCPKCARVMAKYKLTGTVANRVDVCSTCDEAWLDGGEWELLEALQLSTALPAILTEQWQRRIRREQSEGTRRAILTRMIGEDGTSRVEEFRDWLARNQHKSHVLAYLYRN
ncbi:MAG TPA: zf-TFIIB domain-containing protein [Steroidobacteraceae bacterium]|nr:zf-TFIIB domain-containing protein [Steroidobacteraceae bacterium]